MKVTRLPIDPGPAGWNCLLPPVPAGPILEQELNADWLVIGAGITGLAAAERLHQLHPKDRIVVVDASRIAHGPAGRNSGFMIDLPHDLASDDYGGGLEKDLHQTRANRHAISFAKSLVEKYQMPGEALRRSGKINAAATAKGHAHNESYAKHLTQMGEAWDMYDARQMREITGTSYYQSGLLTPGTAMVQPALYQRELAAGLRQGGVEVFERSPVVQLTQDQTWTATTPTGRINAPKCILAVNGHANSFGLYPRQLIHVFTYASMTRALTPGEVKRLGGDETWGVTPADPLGTTVRRVSGIGGHRIIVRNRATYDPRLEVSDRRLRSVARTQRRSFERRFPELAQVEMEYTWGGRLCLSRNNVAAFGEVETGLFAACCQNGLGLAKGTLHGILAAEFASGMKSDLLSEVLNEAPPTRLPPAPLAWLGANALMKWGEFNAGREL